MSLTVNKVLALEAIEGFIPSWIIEARANINSLTPDGNGDIVVDDPSLESRLENLMKRNPAVAAQLAAKESSEKFRSSIDQLVSMIQSADSFDELENMPESFTASMFNVLKRGVRGNLVG